MNLIQIYIIIGPDVCSDNELRGTYTLIYTSWKFGRIEGEHLSFAEYRKDVRREICSRGIRGVLSFQISHQIQTETVIFPSTVVTQLT